MASERSEQSLQGLSENRADAYSRNSDALALDRAGVKHERPEAR
jgi:hypothetical protein